MKNRQQPWHGVWSRNSELHRNRLSGFTLVEILVVISIIAVMIAFLMPSLKNARKRAVELKEMSLMRQMGMASANYVAENRMRLVLYQDDNGVKYIPKISPYMNKFSSKLMICSDDFSEKSTTAQWPSFYWSVPAKVTTKDADGYLFVEKSGNPPKTDIQWTPFNIKVSGYFNPGVMCGTIWPSQDKIDQPSYQVLIRCPQPCPSGSTSGPKYSHDLMRGVIYFDNHGERRYISKNF